LRDFSRSFYFRNTNLRDLPQRVGRQLSQALEDEDSSASDESNGGFEDAGDGDVEEEEEEDAELPAPLSINIIANQLDSLLENFSDLSD
jgi:hypothetical protein